ncbi:uroporphyrinogen-III synthase [Poronia punctata]|nr:uroporphyrinogen-III synthase [Poronia punctata]
MAQEGHPIPEGRRVPLLLLKTKSSPTDAYEILFSTARSGFHFEPIFIPVLRHRLEEEGLRTVGKLIRENRIGASDDSYYGGLIFTSQRAVEAFASLVGRGRGPTSSQDTDGGYEEGWPHLQDVPIYSVGPATTRALEAIPQSTPLRIFGEHTGNGEALAQYILEHYGGWYRHHLKKPPLLFLVGEQRRDIIPKTLMDVTLPANARIEVTETVVYGTGVMESFPSDLEQTLHRTRESLVRWVVVFSPTGCDSTLRALGFVLNKKTGTAVKDASSPRRAGDIYIATIGPTTRDYLINTYGVIPDVCALSPSPEGLWQAITSYEKIKVY